MLDQAGQTARGDRARDMEGAGDTARASTNIVTPPLASGLRLETRASEAEAAVHETLRTIARRMSKAPHQKKSIVAARVAMAVPAKVTIRGRSGAERESRNPGAGRREGDRIRSMKTKKCVSGCRTD